MKPADQSMKKNALTAILSYELSRLESLPTSDQILAAAELSAAIQMLKIGSKSDTAFSKNKMLYYSSIKKAAIASNYPNTREVDFIFACIMECICKSNDVESLHDVLIASVKAWIKNSASKI